MTSSQPLRILEFMLTSLSAPKLVFQARRATRTPRRSRFAFTDGSAAFAAITAITGGAGRVIAIRGGTTVAAFATFAGLTRSAALTTSACAIRGGEFVVAAPAVCAAPRRATVGVSVAVASRKSTLALFSTSLAIAGGLIGRNATSAVAVAAKTVRAVVMGLTGASLGILQFNDDAAFIGPAFTVP
jgi:hypothetical protein